MNRVILCLMMGGSTVACRSDGSLQGTLVGNPGDASLTAAPTAGTTLRTARIAVDELVWIPCDGSSAGVTAVSAELDLLAPIAVAAPSGWWCGLEVAPAGPLLLEADSDAGGEAAIELWVASVEVTSAGFVVGEADPFVLELGHPGWLDPIELGFSGSESVWVDGNAALHPTLVSRVEQGSGLFVDNGNQSIDAAERRAGPVAAGSARPAEDSDDEDED